jgi:hypothetical protein
MLNSNLSSHGGGIKEEQYSPPHGAGDGHDHATGGIVPAVTSPDPSGAASTAVLSPSPLFPLNNRMARANLLHAEWQDAMDTNIATLAPVQEKLLLKKQQWPTCLSVYVALVLHRNKSNHKH